MPASTLSLGLASAPTRELTMDDALELVYHANVITLQAHRSKLQQTFALIDLALLACVRPFLRSENSTINRVLFLICGGWLAYIIVKSRAKTLSALRQAQERHLRQLNPIPLSSELLYGLPLTDRSVATHSGTVHVGTEDGALVMNIGKKHVAVWIVTAKNEAVIGEENQMIRAVQAVVHPHGIECVSDDGRIRTEISFSAFENVIKTAAEEDSLLLIGEAESISLASAAVRAVGLTPLSLLP